MSRRAATSTEGHLAVEPEWRREVSSRLRAYRVRRHGTAVSDSQPALPFEHALASPVQNSAADTYTDAHAGSGFKQSVRALPQRKPRAERFEISIHDTPSTYAHAYSPGLAPSHARSSPDLRFPVASLPERRWAAVLDAALLLFSYGGMLALFTALGGHLGFNKLDAVVASATLALFYAQYYALFTIFGGSTPGMMLRRIRVVSFDGSVPTSRQMAWRSFGYLISAGTCFLGFLWAIWDEDQLCWQDRISQTYLTPMEAFAMPETSSEDLHRAGMGRQTPASTRGR